MNNIEVIYQNADATNLLKSEFFKLITKKNDLEYQKYALQEDYYDEAQFTENEEWKAICWKRLYNNLNEIAEINKRLAEIRKAIGPTILKSWRKEWYQK